MLTTTRENVQQGDWVFCYDSGFRGKLRYMCLILDTSVNYCGDKKQFKLLCFHCPSGDTHIGTYGLYSHEIGNENYYTKRAKE